jgi:hypothetical protein
LYTIATAVRQLFAKDQVVREIGAEFQKEGAEVGIEAIEVELVHGRRALDDPRVLPAVGAAALLGTKDRDLFLGFTEEQNPFGSLKVASIFRRNIVLALSLLEVNDRDVVLRQEVIDLPQKRVRHDSHQGGGSNGLAAMKPEKTSRLLFRLQLGLIDIEVHAIDALDFQGHMVADDFSDGAGYTHG